MKRLATWSLVLLLTALVIAASGAAAAGPPTPRTPRVLEQSVPSRTEDEPIHMPDLRGRTLEYATDIWDDDEPLPQITIVRLSSDPNAVVVERGVVREPADLRRVVRDTPEHVGPDQVETDVGAREVERRRSAGRGLPIHRRRRWVRW